MISSALSGGGLILTYWWRSSNLRCLTPCQTSSGFCQETIMRGFVEVAWSSAGYVASFVFVTILSYWAAISELKAVLRYSCLSR